MALPPPVPVSRAHPLVKRVLAATFPDWKGRKVRVAPWTGPLSLDLNWSGGTKDTVAVIDLRHGVGHLVVGAPWTHDGMVDHAPGSLLVVHSRFMGTDAGITIFVRPPDPDDLTMLGTGVVMAALTA